MEKTFDLLLKNGHIVDGSGNAEYVADIGIKEGKIVQIQTGIDPELSVEVVNMAQQVVAPGFIDTHTHDDLLVLLKPTADEKILQGVTSVVVGNCGFSMGPLDGDRGGYLRNFLARQGSELESGELFSIRRLGDYLEQVEQAAPGINVIPLAGHGTIRMSVMGLEQRHCSDRELDRMKGMLREAMEDGAFGISTGLIYPPGNYAATMELVELARVAADGGGLYTTHMRNEGNTVLEALEETIQIGDEAGIPVHISHHKVAGPQNWGKSKETLALMAKARARGIRVTCDQYPYAAGSTTLSALLPPGYLAMGIDSLSEGLLSPVTRNEIRASIEAEGDDTWENMIKEVGFDKIVLSSSRRKPEYLGHSISQIAGKQGKTEYDALFDLLAVDLSGAGMIIFSMGEEDIVRIMKDPFTMIGSDGIPDFGDNVPHPRMTGTFPRILRKYVREEHVLGLEEAVHKMTSLPAQTFGVKQKGLIAVGYDADLVVFDPLEIADQSDFESPKRNPSGIQYVFVNGSVAVDHGRITGNAHGAILRRS